MGCDCDSPPGFASCGVYPQRVRLGGCLTLMKFIDYCLVKKSQSPIEIGNYLNLSSFFLLVAFSHLLENISLPLLFS